MAQNSGIGIGVADNGENSYQISDDDLEYDDCDEFMDESLPDTNDLPSRNVSGTTRGPYERAWTTDATRALIHIRGPLEGRFTEGRHKRTALWLQCTRQLQRMGYRYSAAKVQKKWHNILITYNKNLNKKYLSGYVHWEFFEEMFKYLEGKKANFEGQQQQQQQLQQQNQQQQQATQQQPIQTQEQSQQHQQQNQKQDSQPNYSLPKLTVKTYPTLRQTNQQQTVKQTIAHYVDPQTLLQPQVQLETKSNDDYDDDSASVPELRQPKIEYDDDNGEQSMGEHSMPLVITHGNSFENILNGGKRDNGGFDHGFHGFEPKADDDSIWWKDYFERKLQTEREKITMQRNMHRDLMQYHKTSLVQQEKIERIKIDAINNLTCALQKLVEAKSRKN